MSNIWAKYRITRRRVSLVVVGLLSIVTGYGLISSPDTPSTKPLYHYLLNVMDFSHWGVLWVLFGSIALATGIINPKEDRVAFGLVSGLFAVWSGCLFLGWFVNNVPRGWVTASTYLLALLLILVISGWPDER